MASTLSSPSQAAINKGAASTCPFLGTLEDPEAVFSYAAEGNFCHRADPPGAVSLPVQQTTCLKAAHAQCPVLLGPKGSIFPKEMADNSRFSEGRSNRLLVQGLAFVVVLALLAGLAYLGMQRLQTNAANTTATAQAAALAYQTTRTALAQQVVVVEDTATLPLLPTDTPRPTATQAPPTATPTFTPLPPTPGPEMETPFGPDNRYVLHTVQNMESINNIAVKYGTTAQVIRALNFMMEGASIQPQRVLVIEPNATEVSEPTLFCTFYLEAGTTISAFAAQYGVPEEQLRTYNALGPQDELPGPRWLIFPYAGITDLTLCR